ncbi:XdhC family protein [Oecophyllibacter saccharovorans]|uniref:XdhC family protein n=1 Tax=Oecophyllibacter saccharovorans TaxID=2558360 RepID=UPI001F4FFE1F|nr:XdhC family protein [Oecophyllibacter saccharovorans]
MTGEVQKTLHPPTPLLPDWPEYGLVDDVVPVLRSWQQAGKRAALATLVSIQGPSPRPLGSEMAISSSGEVVGYVSGGCVEGAVATEALNVLQTRKPQLLDYGAGSPVMDLQLACGGRIGIYVRELHDIAAYTQAHETAARDRLQLVVRTDLGNGRMSWKALPHPEAAELAPHPSSEHSTSSTTPFLRFVPPPLRLVLVGGDPITLALAKLAPFFGLQVHLLRPHGPSQPPAFLAAHSYDRRPLSQSLAELAPDPWTAVYSLSHDAETDHSVTCQALASNAFCIGLLGSKSRIPARMERLRHEGFSPAQLARLHLPAGLPLASRTPSGIALSILAEVLQYAPVFQAGYAPDSSDPSDVKAP